MRGGATVTSIQRDHAPINIDEERRERALTYVVASTGTYAICSMGKAVS